MDRQNKWKWKMKGDALWLVPDTTLWSNLQTDGFSTYSSPSTRRLKSKSLLPSPLSLLSLSPIDTLAERITQILRYTPIPSIMSNNVSAWLLPSNFIFETHIIYWPSPMNRLYPSRTSFLVLQTPNQFPNFYFQLTDSTTLFLAGRAVLHSYFPRSVS